MIVNQKELYKYVDSILVPKGFIRKKDTYYKNYSETICFFVLAKSHFSGKYEDLLGCFYKKIMDNSIEFPPYYKNQLKFGLDDVYDKNIVENTFNLEYNGYRDEEREKSIYYILSEIAIPFLEEISTQQGILRAVNKYPDLIYGMRIELKRELNLTMDDD